MTGRLQDLRTLVIGANRGIGAALARGFADEGAVVACGARRAEDALDIADQLQATGGRAHPVVVDLLEPSSIRRAVAESIDVLGGIDCLVQSAGVTATTPVLDVPFEEWRRVLATNLDGTFLACQEVARHQRDAGIAGSLVVVSSQLSQVAIPNKAHYLASKGALTMLVKSLALELAAHGIRVNALAPGVTETDMAMSRLAEDQAAMAVTLDRIPMGRLGQPQEMVGAAVFLASTEASYVTGSTLVVDGGYLSR